MMLYHGAAGFLSRKFTSCKGKNVASVYWWFAEGSYLRVADTCAVRIVLPLSRTGALNPVNPAPKHLLPPPAGNAELLGKILKLQLTQYDCAQYSLKQPYVTLNPIPLLLSPVTDPHLLQ